MPTPTPEKVKSLLDAWNRSAGTWSMVGYLMLAGSIISSLVITVFADDLKTSVIGVKTLGFVSAACTTLLATFSPIQVGAAFREAWRVLYYAILRYEIDPAGNVPILLLDAIVAGEGLIKKIPVPSTSDSLIKQNAQDSNEAKQSLQEANPGKPGITE